MATASPKRHPYHQWSPDARALDIVGDKWTLLIVRDLSTGPRRFVALQRGLPGISTETLRLRLNRMVAAGLLTRQRYREVPPRVDYNLTPRAQDLLPVIAALARWGYDWEWSAPRDQEHIDVAAILRAAPALVTMPEGIDGSTVCEVRHAASTTDSFTVSVRRGAVTIANGDVVSPQAHVTGSQAAWVHTLSPECRPWHRPTRQHDLDALRIRGDHQLARLLLDGLRAAASPHDQPDASVA